MHVLGKIKTSFPFSLNMRRGNRKSLNGVTLIQNYRLRNRQEVQSVRTSFIIWRLHRQMYGELVRVTGTFVYRRLCWRFVVMTVPFTQEIKFKHLRNNSQLDKYLCIDIVKDLSAEFNYSNLKLWPRDVILIEISAAARRVIKLKPVLFILHTSMIYHSKPITTLNFLSH